MSSDEDLQKYNETTSKDLRIVETKRKTQEALNRVLNKKLVSGKVTTLSTSGEDKQSTYVKYTSAQLGNSTDAEGRQLSRQRIIKVTDEHVDPMLPSSFQIRKAPPGPQTDSIVPVLHNNDGNADLSKTDQKKWNITPAVSNWKNTKGFIIGIENRVLNSAQRGTSLTPAQIERSTKKFTTLSDALKEAEKKAKEDLAMRSSWRKQKVIEKSTDTKERLSKLAEEARKSRQYDQNLQGMSKQERREERRRRAQEELKRDKTTTRDKIRRLAKDQGREVSDRVLMSVTEAFKKKQDEAVFDSSIYLKSGSNATNQDEDKVYDTPLFSQEAVLSDVYRTRNSHSQSGLNSKSSVTESNYTAMTFVKETDTSEIEEKEEHSSHNMK
ncbi:hypothetical protein CANINC_001401 [Pichia inconspicua]|uniref:Pre-mRNA-processing protein 45 n=1 Tax=Pichia inconspicua TaxID=52247 RepID=A0A4T0X511_9ASCO|nr:hypothetical protein CANINC_001401 [[Candida] inconspicua]